MILYNFYKHEIKMKSITKKKSKMKFLSSNFSAKVIISNI